MSSQVISHSSSVMAIYAVSSVGSNSYSYSAPVTVATYAISCYTGARHYGILLYFITYIDIHRPRRYKENTRTSLWRHMSVLASHITGNSVVFPTTFSGYYQRGHHRCILLSLCKRNPPVTGGSPSQWVIDGAVYPRHDVIILAGSTGVIGCYIDLGPGTWTSARSICAGLGGYVLALESREELDAISGVY